VTNILKPNKYIRVIQMKPVWGIVLDERVAASKNITT
jgi:hypothetical protein